MNIAALSATGSRIKARVKNRNLKSVTLFPSEENKRLVLEYNKLVEKINGVPARIAGLHMNYRKSEMAAVVNRILAERETDMVRLLELEKVLFPKDAA